MSKYVLSAEDREKFEQIINEGIREEQEKKKKNPGRFVYDETFQEYLDDTNDFEKHYILEHYERNGDITSVGLSQIRSVYKTDVIEDNYDAYELGKKNVKGDFDIQSVTRDDDGNLISADFLVHSDRWAFMADSFARDKKHVETVTV